LAHAHDLVIRGGEIFEGDGGGGFIGDVAVDNGRITAVGDIAGAGAEEIEADGLIVTPGFVDIHTHYDGQATWDARMQPSSWHGVTTVVMGNCGVGFAPCRSADHDRLIRLMEGVEDIPFPVLTEGLPWNWESYPDYLDGLSSRRFDVDIASQLPHAAVRVFVMGQRGADREPASGADIAAMASIAEAAARAGALGFSTSRTLNHRTSDGQPTPTLTASEDELTGIAMGLSAANAGVLQVVSDFADAEAEFAMLRRIAQRSGRPLSFTLVQSPIHPEGYKTLLAALEGAVASGVSMKAQVAPRPVGVLLGLELTLNPFTHHRRYKEIAVLPLAERVARLRDPLFRSALFAEPPEGGVRGMQGAWGRMHLMGSEPDYEPTADSTVAAHAQASDVSPEDVALDHMLSGGGRGMLYVPILNYAQTSLDPARTMLTHADTVPGLSDGGAHVGMICDGSFPTSMVTHWTRDRTRGEKLPLGRVVRMQTRDTAEAVGLLDRGRLKPGYRADINVIDYRKLKLHAPQVVYDLPAGGRRLIQRASGYVASVVGGEVTYRDGEPTEKLPGRLVRGARAAPLALAAE
jgi:N-acyl-D-aspartate/D-glutamate deacylase